MAKRSNPFVDDFIPQSKVHVGIKQFNNNKDRLQKVYEKTLQMLFSGAKKMPVVEHIVIKEAQSDKRDKLKQLCIGRDGSLDTVSSALILDRTKSNNVCVCGSATTDTNCAYCEVKLCSYCQQNCVRCERPYCSRCSFGRSEGFAVCVSCYG